MVPDLFGAFARVSRIEEVRHHFARRANWGLTPFPKNRSVPFFLVAVLVAGCASAPAPRSPAPKIESAPATQAARDDDDAWYGGGGISREQNRGDAVADFALRLRGTRYRFGGATPAGFDCSGLVFFTHRELGLAVPRTSRDQAEEAENVKPRKLRRGDLVFFKIGSSRVNHVGIYVGKHRFVHAPGAGKPVAINSLDDEFYAETFVAAGRFWDRQPR